MPEVRRSEDAGSTGAGFTSSSDRLSARKPDRLGCRERFVEHRFDEPPAPPVRLAQVGASVPSTHDIPPPLFYNIPTFCRMLEFHHEVEEGFPVWGKGMDHLTSLVSFVQQTGADEQLGVLGNGFDVGVKDIGKTGDRDAGFVIHGEQDADPPMVGNSLEITLQLSGCFHELRICSMDTTFQHSAECWNLVNGGHGNIIETKKRDAHQQ